MEDIMLPRITRLITLVALFGLLATGLPFGLVSAQDATPSAQGAASPRYEPPTEITAGDLSDETLRAQLISSKETACGDLELIAGVLVSTGVLPKVPPMISALTGLPIDELEARETQACQQVGDEVPDEEKTTVELLNEANTAQWLVQIHLGAMDHVMLEAPTYRPIAAEGCFAPFFEMHNLSIEAMREAYLALVNSPTLEEAQALGAFWTDVLLPHARAEDATMWDLARSLDNPNLTRSADLVEAEHQTIEAQIATYLETLAAVEAGDAELSALVPLAETLRIRTELHFGKEEITVVRPMQEQLSSEEFRPVIEELDQELGDWLDERGWSMEGCD
jgi:hypothetical protein